MSTLFETVKPNQLTLQNRVVMAPIVTKSTNALTGKHPEPYDGNLLSTTSECWPDYFRGNTDLLRLTRLFFTPGVYTDEQVEGWKLVTQAAKQFSRGNICQLWHVGRFSSRISTRSII